MLFVNGEDDDTTACVFSRGCCEVNETAVKPFVEDCPVIKLGNISNLIPSPSSYQCRKITVNMKISGFYYDTQNFHYN
jgi:hypothetical protein